MKNYEKPIVLANSELSEGVYAASGGGGCWNPKRTITDNGDGTYTISLLLDHVWGSEHHSIWQSIVLTFNQPVKYLDSKPGKYGKGDETDKLRIDYTIGEHSSELAENINFGVVIVRPANSSMPLTLEIKDVYCGHEDPADCTQPS